VLAPTPPKVFPAPAPENVGQVLGVNAEGNRAVWIDQASGIHYLLTGRDAGNQHPISAITGLQEALDILNNLMKEDENE